MPSAAPYALWVRIVVGPRPQGRVPGSDGEEPEMVRRSHSCILYGCTADKSGRYTRDEDTGSLYDASQDKEMDPEKIQRGV